MEDNLERARNTTLATARTMLAGEIDLLDGCRILVAKLKQLGLDDHPSVVALVGIDSECDDLPSAIGMWASAVRPEIQAERERYLNVVRPVVMDACKVIVSKLEKPQE